jgi:hypothetical protein
MHNVEEILDHRWRKGTEQREYLVRWEGFPAKYNSWVSEDSMASCSLLEQYKRAKRFKKGSAKGH